MPLNLDRFRGASLVRPRDKVAVSSLVPLMFDTVDEAWFHIRGLMANEMFIAKEARAEHSPLHALAEAIKSGDKSEMTEAFRKMMGNSTDSIAAETAYRHELIKWGVIDPETGENILDDSDVSKIGEHFPLVFLQVSDKIMALSGQGSSVGEASGRSGNKTKSGAS